MLGRGGGVPKGLVHNLFCSFSPWAAQKIEVIIKLFFVDIVTTQKDHATYEKHILVTIYMFFHLFWVLGVAREGGGLSQKMGTQPTYAVCHAR